MSFLNQYLLLLSTLLDIREGKIASLSLLDSWFVDEDQVYSTEVVI